MTKAKCFFSNFSTTNYTTSILSCIANVTKRKDLSPPIQNSHLRELFFSPPRYKYITKEGVKCFKQGGYTVSKTKMNGIEVLLVIDHGPLGYLSIAAHGHADALSIWLHLNGLPVLVDAGTYLYHSGRNWRSHMRGTNAHNTLSIDHQDSSKISGPFNWENKANCTLVKIDHDNKHLSLCAEHDGYQNKYKVNHRRIIEKYPDGNFIVKDCLYGSSNKLPVAIGFLIHPDLSVSKQGHSWCISHHSNPILKIESKTDFLKSSLKNGETDPMQGWYSDAFGHKSSTTRLVFSGSINPEQESIISFMPVLS